MDYHLEDRSGITWVSVGQSAYMDLARCAGALHRLRLGLHHRPVRRLCPLVQVGAAAGKTMTRPGAPGCGLLGL